MVHRGAPARGARRRRGGGAAGIAEAAAVAATGLRPVDAVVEAYATALDRYEALGRGGDVGRMQVEIGYAMVTAGRLEEAPGWVERGISALERQGESADLARALEVLGNLQRRRGAPADAEGPLRRSLEMAARIDAPVVRGHAAISLGVVLLHLGRVDEGMGLIEQGREIAESAGHLELLLRAHNALPSTLMDYAPDYERGRRMLLEGIELSRRSGRRDHEAWMWTNIGNYAFDQGRIDELEHAAEVSLEIGRLHANPYALGAGAMLAGQAAFLRGRAGRRRRVRGAGGAHPGHARGTSGRAVPEPAPRMDRPRTGGRGGGAAGVSRGARRAR